MQPALWGGGKNGDSRSPSRFALEIDRFADASFSLVASEPCQTFLRTLAWLSDNGDRPAGAWAIVGRTPCRLSPPQSIHRSGVLLLWSIELDSWTRSFDRGSGTCSPSTSVVLELTRCTTLPQPYRPKLCTEVVCVAGCSASVEKHGWSTLGFTKSCCCTWEYLHVCDGTGKRESLSRSWPGHAGSRCHFSS